MTGEAAAGRRMSINSHPLEEASHDALSNQTPDCSAKAGVPSNLKTETSKYSVNVI